MEVIAQKLDDIVDSLRPLTVEWTDETALRVIERLGSFPLKASYTEDEVRGSMISTTGF